MQYHIEQNAVQETLVIPLFARKICSERYPSLFSDPEAERICSMLDYDFASREKKMRGTMGLFGALEVAQRQYDLAWEVRNYLGTHPNAAVVNLGCGLDDTVRKTDNGTRRFPGGVLVFDSCNRRGARMMTKTWLKEAGIRDVDALFSLDDTASIKGWSEDFASVTVKSYMRGYRDISDDLGFIHRKMLKFCDGAVNMRIVKITFREE